MKAIALFVVMICLVGSALGQTAPKLPQQFTSNFSVVFPNYVSPLTSLINIGGVVAFDWTNGGIFIELGGEEFVPLSFHTNLVVSPNNGALTPYVYEGPLCWEFGSLPAIITTYFPFQIPANATYLGAQVINGQPCTGWQFYVNVFGIVTPITPVTLWVSSKDGSILQIVISDVDYNIGDVQVNFFNTLLGPFSPSIYAPPTKANPNLACQKIQF